MISTQPLYDILREAFDVGRSYEQTEYEFHGIPIGSQIIPLAARMETEVQKLVEEEHERCIIIADEVAMDLHRDGERMKSFGADVVAQRLQSLPSSPERETKVV